MAYILDGVVILIFLLAVYSGYRRGFVVSVIYLVGCAAAALVALTLSKPLATSVYDMFLSNKVEQTVSAQISSSNTKDVASLTNSVAQVMKDLPGPVSNFMSTSGYTPEKIAGSLSGSVSSSSTDLSNKIVNTVVRPVSISLLQALCYVILFFVVMILVRIVASTVNHVFRLPLLRQINGVLGAVLGAAQGVLYVFLAVTVISMIAASSAGDGKITQDVMDHTVIVHAVQNINPATNAWYSLFI